MQTEFYYLKDEVYFEPLFNQWYAWSYLIPPVTAARYMVGTHKRIMNSFIQNYKLHIMAVNQPGMEGSDFLDCSEEQLSDIKALVEQIDTEHKDYVELANAVKELDDMLRNHTSGESVEGLYEKVPGPLKGYVELVMDMEHNPSYRIIESLVYRSELYKPELQSVSFGLLSKVDSRPFALSTPRLPDEDHLQLKLDYNSAKLKRILAARDNPISAEELDELFRDEAISGGLNYRDLFTTVKPSSVYPHKPVDEGVQLTYIGHAGLMVETKDTAILIDPIIASRAESYKDDIISFSQLPSKIDYICITHNHQDHVCLESLLQLRHKTNKVLVPKNNGGSLPDPSLKLLLKQFEFDVLEMDDLEEVLIPNGKIMSIPFLGEHGDLNIRSKTAWFFDICGKKIFAGADSSNLDPKMYEHIRKHIGKVDVMAIGMECVGAPYTWIYGALYTKMVTKKIKESRRLNGSDSAQAFRIAEIFEPNSVYLYALGLEPWYKYFMGIEYDENSMQIVETDKLIKACAELGLPAYRLYGKRVIDIDEQRTEPVLATINSAEEQETIIEI